MNTFKYPNLFSSPDFLNKSLKLFAETKNPNDKHENAHNPETLSQTSLVGAMSGILIDSQKPRFDSAKDGISQMAIDACMFQSQMDMGKENHAPSNSGEIQKFIEDYQEQMNMEMDKLRKENNKVSNELIQLKAEQLKSKKMIKAEKRDKNRERIQRIRAEKKIKQLQDEMKAPVSEVINLSPLKTEPSSFEPVNKEAEIRLKTEYDSLKHQAVKEIAELRRHLYLKQQDLDQMQAMLEDYHVNYECLESEYDNEQLLCEQANEDIVDLLTDALVNNVQTEESEELCLQKLKKLDLQLKKSANDVSSLDKRLMDKEEENAALKLEISVLNRLFEEMSFKQEELNRAIDKQKALEAENVLANKKITTLIVKIEHARFVLESSNNKIKELSTVNESLQSQILEVQMETDNVVQNDTIQKAKIDALEIENAQLTDRIASIDSRLKDNESAMSQLEGQNQALKSQVDQLVKTKNQFEKRLEGLITDIDDLEQAKYQALDKVCLLEEQIVINNAEIDKQTNDVKTLEDQLAMIKDQQAKARESSLQSFADLKKLEEEQSLAVCQKEEEIKKLNEKLAELDKQLFDALLEKDKINEPQIIPESQLEQPNLHKISSNLESILMTSSKRKFVQDNDVKTKAKQVRFGGVEKRMIAPVANKPKYFNYDFVKPLRPQLDLVSDNNNRKASPIKNVSDSILTKSPVISSYRSKGKLLSSPGSLFEEI